ncbi:hypothetical protein DM860_013396 [Cuscuta australis]|uniref:EF-hand domain-containing protein n=1 Tax=Cuscuta australis TaxID=267555 RepID=A0A328DTK4_9ASTE|nr:hypothetical protein DM860_013396 [Cuscuta australis]
MCPTGTTTGLFRLGETSNKPSTLRSAFQVLDVDHDGKISRHDLLTFYADFSVAGPSSEDDLVGAMISVADLNKDGFVEYDEFEKVVAGRPQMKNEVMEEVFKAMDRDGDGQVGLQDLKTYLDFAGLPADDEDLKAMIKLGGGYDNRGGGGVTFQGFCNILALSGC